MALLSGELNARTWQERQQQSCDDRLQAIARSWDYYEGRHPPPLSVQPGQPDDNVIVNLARPVVDKGIALLFGREVTWQADESAATTSDAETFLKAVWAANDKMVLLQEVAQNGALAGLCAVKVVPRPGDKQRPFRLVNLDPKNLTIDCDDEDIDDVERYVIQYTCCDAAGRELIKRQEITAVEDERTDLVTSWTIQNYVAQGSGGKMLPDGPPIAWPYPLPPIVHAKNLPCANSVWGYGDLEDVAFNDAINLIASTTRKILRLHASPQTWIRGQNPGLLRRDANQLWQLEEGTEIGNLEISAESLNAARQFYQDLRSAFFAMGRMPDVSQIGNLGALTNFGLRVLFADALERTATKRNTYGGLLMRLNRLLCLLGGTGDNVTTTLTWPDPLPVNREEIVRTAQQEQAIGVTSDETIATDLGRDYAQEQARLDAERKARAARAPRIGASGPRATPADVLPGDTPAENDPAMQLAQQAMQQMGGQA